MFMQATIEVIY